MTRTGESRTPAIWAASVALALAAANAWAAPALRPGEYETQRSWGSLSIEAAAGGGQRFSIETLGGNAHTCSLQGKIENGIGRAEDSDAASPCLVTFRPEGDAIEVGSSTPEACRMFCGMRAMFEGSYLLPPNGGKPKERAARKEEFSRRYRARDYSKALATIERLDAECGKFFAWIEIDRLRNDHAITLHHLGRGADCRAALGKTRAARFAGADALREELPPTDFENYLPVAKATWHNLKLCGKAPSNPLERRR